MSMFDALMGGDLTPDEWTTLQQQQQQPSAQDQYLEMFNPTANLPGAMQLAQLTGVGAEKAQYRPDDIRALLTMLNAAGVNQAKFQTGQEQNALQNQLAQAGLGLKQQAQAAELGDPTQAMWALQTTGMDPETAYNVFTKHDDPNQQQNLDAIAQSVGALEPDPTDPNGQRMTWHTARGVNLMHGVFQAIQTARQQGGEQQATNVQKQRWQSLDPEMRAKEMYLRLQSGGKQPLAVNARGDVFTGPDAELRAISPPPAKTQWMTQAELKAAGKPQPAKGKGGGGGIGGIFSQLTSPGEYATAHPQARTIGDWFMGRQMPEEPKVAAGDIETAKKDWLSRAAGGTANALKTGAAKDIQWLSSWTNLLPGKGKGKSTAAPPKKKK